MIISSQKGRVWNSQQKSEVGNLCLMCIIPRLFQDYCHIEMDKPEYWDKIPVSWSTLTHLRYFAPLQPPLPTDRRPATHAAGHGYSSQTTVRFKFLWLNAHCTVRPISKHWMLFVSNLVKWYTIEKNISWYFNKQYALSCTWIKVPFLQNPRRSA